MQPLSDSLLQRLGEHATRMDHTGDVSVATITAEIDERDGNGRLLHAHHLVTHVTRTNGHRTTRVVEATRDGKDARTRARLFLDAFDRRKDKTDSPFTPSDQANHCFSVIGPDAENPQFLRVTISPSEKNPSGIIGATIVDPVAGESVRLSFRPAKLAMGMERADFVVDYSSMTPDGRMLSTVRINASVGVLMLRRQYEARIGFVYSPISAVLPAGA